MRYERLLVPVDPSGCAHEVVAHAATIARAFGARVRLLFVLEPTPGVPEAAHLPDTGGLTVHDFLDREGERQLQPLRAQLEAAGVEVDISLRHGEVVEAVLGVVDETRPDLIVMGTHGRAGLRRLFEGSVAESVIRKAQIPVFVIHAGPDTADEVNPLFARVMAEGEG